MTHMHDSPQQKLHFYVSASYPCSYLPEQLASSLVATPFHNVDAKAYSTLVANGFRRSGVHTYRPHCASCQACIPIRIPVDSFVPNRSQRRALKLLTGVSVAIDTPFFAEDHYKLYRAYQNSRHQGSSMDQDDIAQYKDFLLQSHVETKMVVFSSPPPQNTPPADHEADAGKETAPEVKMVTLMDVVGDGLSAVYTFFDPSDTRGLGTLSILWMILQAQKMSLPYVYLGYWIKDSPKMRYKANFMPQERFTNGGWHPAISHGKILTTR